MPGVLEEPREVAYVGNTRAGEQLVQYSYPADVQLPVQQRPGSSPLVILAPPQLRPIHEVDGDAIEEPESLPPRYQDITTGTALPNKTSNARVSKRVLSRV